MGAGQLTTSSMEHEIWFTAILNKILSGALTPLLAEVGVPPADPAHPIPNYVAMEVFVLLLLAGGALYLRRGLSLENPRLPQHLAEVTVQFVQNLCEEIIGHGAEQYVGMIGTLGLFVLLCNLLSVIPSLGVPFRTLALSPTGFIQVTFGCAVIAFLYYNYHGIRHHGVLGYLKTLGGPVVYIAPAIFAVELFSNVFRLLSLSVRLYANMFVGGILEYVFGRLVPIAVPALMMGLHVFVSLIQAYIFMLLPAVYISLATAEEH